MMFRNGLRFAAVALPLSAAALPAQQDPAARALVVRALDHMGGESVVRGLRTLTYNSAAVTWALGQEPAEGEPAPMNMRTSVVRLDFERLRFSINSEFPFNGPNATTFRQFAIQSPTGSMVDNNGNRNPNPAAPSAGPPNLRFFPSRLLLTALDPATRLERVPARRENRGQQGVKMTAALDTLTLWFDASGKLAATETLTDDPILGDRLTRTTFSNWLPVGRDGLRLPAQLSFTANGRPIQTQTYNTATPNAEIPDSLFTVPDSIAARSRALAAGPPPVTVRLDSIAPGVWHVAGGSHNSLAVIQGDSTILIELPQSTPRMRAVLDTLARRFPTAPVKLAVLSHDHWDHAGGVRAVLGARVPVIAHINNMPTMRSLSTARRTLIPDGVERLRHDIRPMDDSLAIGSGANRVMIYHLPTTHDDGMLVAFVPDAGVLFVADVIPSPAQLPNREVADFARTRGLSIQKVAPAHGAVINFSQVTQLAQQ